MPPVFGFGVGDFIAGIQLVIEVGKCLQDAAGSRREFLHLIDQFRAFERPLVFFMKYAQAHETEMEEQPHLQNLIRDVQAVIDDMFEKIDQYQRHLSPALIVGLKAKTKAVVAKIQFRFFVKEDIAHWQQRLAIHALALNSMIGITQARAISEMQASLRQDHAMASKNIVVVHQLLRELPGEIESLLDSGRRLSLSQANESSLSTSVAVIQRNVDETLSRLTRQQQQMDESYLTQQSTGAKLDFFLINLERLQQNIRDLQGSIQAQGWRNQAQLFQYPKPITFEDARGIVCHFTLDYVTCVEDFQAHLEQRWKYIPGLDLVKSKRYVLQDAHTFEDIILKDPIRSSLRPGQTILMSMCYRHPSPPSMLCPGCYATSTEEVSSGGTCSSCGLSYRIIEELDADDTLQDAFADLAIDMGQSQPNILCDYARVRLLKAARSARAAFTSAPMLHGDNMEPSQDEDVPNSFNYLLKQYFKERENPNELMDLEMLKAQAFWNPLEHMSTRDSAS